ncbi:MAG: aminotransferase class III-fold pyridoxal phosphate-dependent enzyme [Armatimonadota bacterium]|nr:aminotransferase class III-fold pyridoxal phosphate-dependent enzyme [Armatimonadota bacterium]MDR7533266.1 aminotransferase class III-fold pyridoxal phosphate-dependent enzyme [Armatimonadota bacterium]MDR7536941.1 aminotransferase class III-fold pyridoxal phosphate-dependent enzyme [Armatimonadota bacterium]
MSSSDDLLRRYGDVAVPAIYRYTDLTFVRGEGVYLYDADGARYLDLAAGIATMAVGHCHPRVVAAVTEQARTLLHGAAHIGVMDPYVALLERLRGLVPARLRQGRGLLLNSGSEAIEAAAKLARYATGRPMLIAFHHAFHGRPMGALSLTASVAAYRRRLSGLLPGVYHAVYPAPHLPLGATPEARGAAALALLEDALRTVVPPEDVAGIVVEPIVGEGGYLVPPSGFLEGLWALARRHDLLVIADEVQTGLGRTGRWFAVEHWGLEPDILVLGKALGGGLPLGAVLARREIADAWQPGAHGSTFGGNPVACRAGLATIDVIEAEGLLERARTVGAFIADALRAARADVPVLGDVRGLGLMIGADVVDPATGRPDAARTRAVLAATPRAGLVLTKCGEATVRISPPLILTREQAQGAVEALLGVLRQVGGTTSL